MASAWKIDRIQSLDLLTRGYQAVFFPPKRFQLHLYVFIFPFPPQKKKNLHFSLRAHHFSNCYFYLIYRPPEKI